MQDSDIKQAMRERYDGFATNVARELERIHEPREVWRMAEGPRPALAYYRRRKLETALRLGGFRPGASLLDIGCATGDYTLLLARQGFRMTGLDLSPASIDTARRKAQLVGHDEMRFIVGDAETIADVPDGAFDGVVSFSALRYVPNLDRALKAIARVLKPGGTAVLDFPNRYCPWFKLLKTCVGVETHFHDHHYTAAQIRRFFEAAGLADVRVRHLLYTSYLTPTRLLPVFRLVDRVGERVPLFNRTAAIVMARGIRP